MGYKLELNPEAFARTQQGGCVMTATDTDTNIIEPLILKEGRAGGRTAINRDGLIYNVLPYEPAMSLKNGVMVLSEEPLGENLSEYTEKISEWTVNGTVTVTDLNTTSPNGENDASTIETSTTNNGVYRPGSAVISGESYSEMFRIKHLSGGDIIRHELTSAFGNRFINIDIENGVIITDVSGLNPSIEEESDGWFLIKIKNFQAVNNNSANALFYNASATAMNYSVWGYNLVQDENIYSYIPNHSTGTSVRLGATGVKTPDISKYINSKKGTIVLKVQATSGTNRVGRFVIGDGSSANEVFIDMGNDSITKLICRYTKGSVIQSNTTDTIDFSSVTKIGLSFKEGSFIVSVNGVTENNVGLINTIDDNGLKYISLQRYTGGAEFLADLFNMTILSESVSEAELNALTTL